jgi:hypothetical protein
MIGRRYGDVRLAATMPSRSTKKTTSGSPTRVRIWSSSSVRKVGQLMVFGRKQEASDEGTGLLKHPKPPLPSVDGEFRQVIGDDCWEARRKLCGSALPDCAVLGTMARGDCAMMVHSAEWTPAMKGQFDAAHAEHQKRACSENTVTEWPSSSAGSVGCNVAAIASRWLFRNAAHRFPGSGSLGAFLIQRNTVRSETSKPSIFSSP